MTSKKNSLPTWRDETHIKLKTEMAKEVSRWLNVSLVPLCRDCQVSLTEDNFRDFMEDFNNVGEIFVENQAEAIENEFLSNAVREQARKRFADYREKWEAKPPRIKSGSSRLNGDHIRIAPEDVMEYIVLRDGVFDFDEKEIIRQHTHTVDVDTETYRKVEELCEAINQVFENVRFDNRLLLSMLRFDDTMRVSPSPFFKYELLKLK